MHFIGLLNALNVWTFSMLVVVALRKEIFAEFNFAEFDFFFSDKKESKWMRNRVKMGKKFVRKLLILRN